MEQQPADNRSTEDTATKRRKSKISDTPVVVFNTGFILLIQMAVIWIFCS